MSAEDLDKLFRDKLNQKSVAPSNEAWERLQARLQVPAQEEEKRPVMWYYSAAAAITMLVSVGLWTLNQDNNPLQPAGTVATVQQPKPAAPAAGQPEGEVVPADGNAPFEKEVQPQATEAQPAASSSQEGLLAKAEPAQHRNTVAYPSSPAKRNGTTHPTPEERKTTVRPEPDMMAAAATTTKKAPVAAPAQDAPLEIIIKLDNKTETALAQASPAVADEEADTEDKGAGRVLKGILKQVKNLKDCEKVNLSEIGIAKHTFALETRIGNKTISKTIEL